MEPEDLTMEEAVEMIAQAVIRKKSGRKGRKKK
jgi:hypothetical protein